MPDDLWKFTEQMNQELNYTGVGLIQFMVDRDRDEISFLELNPRFNGNTAVPDHAGLELVRLAMDLAIDPDREEKVFISQGGLRHAWLYGDLQGIWKSLKHGMMTKRQVPAATYRALRDGLTADFHIIWSWRDPKPGIMQFVKLIKR
jgi:biotin carboxylase